MNKLNQISNQIKIDLIISNLDPKLNETVTITALNVPNFTDIALDNVLEFCKKNNHNTYLVQN